MKAKTPILCLLLATLPPMFTPGLKADDSAPFKILHSFSPYDKAQAQGGLFPRTGLILGADGNFYGTTDSGGANLSGTIFRITPAGDYSVLYSFSATTPTNHGTVTNNDGLSPTNLIQAKDGSFYGTAWGGGPKEGGTFFKLTTNGGVAFKVLHYFTGVEGSNCTALLQGKDGNFYGTLRDGGANGNGTVFKMTPAGDFSYVYKFSGYKSGDVFPPVNDEGTEPTGLIQGGDDNFYCSARYGGPNGRGALSKITPAGELTVLHGFSAVNKFTNDDGVYPSSDLTLSRSGNFLYGTAQQGGTKGHGTNYLVTVNGKLSPLHSFDTNEGTHPIAKLVEGKSDNSFYATTYYGGANGKGTIYRLLVRGDTVLQVVHSFTDDEISKPGFTSELVQGNDKNFYGTTDSGGENKTGTVFMINIINPVITSANAVTTPVGKSFNYQITATKSPLKYGADHLKGTGLSIDEKSGIISGTPKLKGTFKILLQASNTIGYGSALLTLTVN